MNTCRSAVNHNVECMKNDGKVSDEYRIDLVNYKEAEDYGVGQYGFSKQASTIDFAPIITRGGHIVSDIDQLVKTASDVADEVSKLVPIQTKLHEIEKVFGKDKCYVLSVRPVGGVEVTPDLFD